jgi:hypothetical protein
MINTGRRFSLGTITLTFVLGLLVTAVAGLHPLREYGEHILDRDLRIQVPEGCEPMRHVGKFSSAPFPLTAYEAVEPRAQGFIVEDVLVLEALDGSSGGCLYLFQDGPGTVSPRSSRFYAPDSTGTKLLGGVILSEVYEARVNELSVEVEGPTFSYQRRDETYNLVKVEEIHIYEAWRLPLIVSHSFELASGNYHFCFSGKERVEFPCKFPVGYIHHEDEFGNAEHNLHVLLNGGEVVHIEFNSTGPINFGLLKPSHHTSHGIYAPGSTSFRYEEADDFYVMETNITSTSFEFRAPERGYYNLLFKAYTGKEGTVSLNVTRQER